LPVDFQCLSVDSGPYVQNMIRAIPLKNNILITTEHGSWVNISREEYNLFKFGRVEENEELFTLLEKKGVIITKNNLKNVAGAYIQRKCHLFQGTSLHIVVTTLRCNHNCLYCHSKAKPFNIKGYDMDTDTARSVVDFIFQTPSNCITIEFQGGEPLLNFPIIEFIIDYANKKNRAVKKDLRFSLVTNLTKMDDDIAKMLLGNKNLGICTSLDGPKEVHNKNRKYLSGRGSYEDVIYWIQRLKEEYRYDRLNSLLVTTRFSLPYPKEIVEEYLKWDFKYIWSKYVNNLGFANSVWSKISYTPEEYFKYWKEMLMHIKQNSNNLIEVSSYVMLKKILADRDPMMTDLQSPCGAAIGQLAYNQWGDIYSCDEGKLFDIFKLGNVKKDCYKDVLTSPRVCSIIATSTNDIYSSCDICPWKPFCGVCVVCNYATQGNLIGKLACDFRCNVLKRQFKFIFEKFLFDENFRKLFNSWMSKADGLFKYKD